NVAGGLFLRHRREALQAFVQGARFFRLPALAERLAPALHERLRALTQRAVAASRRGRIRLVAGSHRRRFGLSHGGTISDMGARAQRAANWQAASERVICSPVSSLRAMTEERAAYAAEREVFSPSALVRQARELLERNFPLLWIEGEISNFSRPA